MLEHCQVLSIIVFLLKILKPFFQIKILCLNFFFNDLFSRIFWLPTRENYMLELKIGVLKIQGELLKAVREIDF